MDFTEQTMKDLVFVDPYSLGTYDNLRYGIQLALDYNIEARYSKKKGKT